VNIPTPADRFLAEECALTLVDELAERWPGDLADLTPALRADLLERLWWLLGCARLAELTDLVVGLEKLRALVSTPELAARLEARHGAPS